MKYIQLLYDFLCGLSFTILTTNNSKLASFCRKRLLSTKCNIDKLVYIENKNRFYAKKGSALYHGTHILNHNGNFYLGERSHLGAFCHINVCYGNITIGNHVAIGPGVSLIAYSNHYKKNELVVDTYIQEDIYIGDNVFLGSNVSVLPGSRISDNVVVGANAVVKGHLESGCIYAGTPAKFMKTLETS